MNLKERIEEIINHYGVTDTRESLITDILNAFREEIRKHEKIGSGFRNQVIQEIIERIKDEKT